MKKLTPSALARLSLLSGALLAAPAAFAASSWDLSGNSTSPGCSQSTTNANNYGNSWSCTSTGAPTMTGTAYSTTGSGTTFATANLALYQGNGFGVQNSVEGLNANAPNHSLDSATNTDVMLLSFASSVSLNSITLGWSYSDSDISVLRYTGTTAPVVVGGTTANLVANGWNLVGNYLNVTGVTPSSSNQPGGTVAVNSSNLSSSWWLISAYNSGYSTKAAESSSATSGFDTTSDYIKVLSVAGTPTTTTPPNKVPEPASVPLVGLAFMGMAWVSRRSLTRRAKAA